MTKLLKVVVVLVATLFAACGDNNSAQKGERTVKFNLDVTCEGPAVADDGAVSMKAKTTHKLHALGPKNSTNNCGAANKAAKWTVEYDGKDGIRTYEGTATDHWTAYEDRLEGLHEVGTIKAVAAGFSVALTTSTAVSMKAECLPEASYDSTDGVFSVGKGATIAGVEIDKDLQCRGTYNALAVSGQPVLVGGAMQYDRAFYAKGIGPDICKDAKFTRLESYLEGSDKVQWFAFRVNGKCEVIGSGSGTVSFTGNTPTPSCIGSDCTPTPTPNTCSTPPCTYGKNVTSFTVWTNLTTWGVSNGISNVYNERNDGVGAEAVSRVSNSARGSSSDVASVTLNGASSKGLAGRNLHIPYGSIARNEHKIVTCALYSGSGGIVTLGVGNNSSNYSWPEIFYVDGILLPPATFVTLGYGFDADFDMAKQGGGTTPRIDPSVNSLVFETWVHTGSLNGGQFYADDCSVR